jgi:hypothetical protein
MATKQKPTKAELSTATDAGMDARKSWVDGGPKPECDYADGPLMTAWSNGWRGQDDFEKKQTVELAGGIVVEVVDGKVEHDVVTDGETQLESHGHNVTDPEVAEHREELAGLMTAFDNHGVQIVEEQWRALSDNERSVAAKWANDMRIGEVRPCPEFLLKFATEELKAASVQHHAVQAEQRRILVCCRFLKPSAILPTGDEGEDALKMTLVIPDSELNRPSLAEEFLHGKRLNIEFSRRSADPAKWQPELPGCETMPEIIECVSDVKGYSRNMTAYKFAFKISTDLIDDNSANREYAKQDGSVRLTLIGDIPAKKKEEEPTAAIIEKSRPLPSGPSLFGDDESESDDDSDVPYVEQCGPDGEFFSPDEYIVDSHVPHASTIISIGIKDGSYYGSIDTVFFDDEGNEFSEDWGNPQLSNGGSASLSLAVQKEIGTAIDYLMEKNASAKCLKDLRDELKRLEDGGEPRLMPEE